MYLKSTNSLVHTMIAVLFPYLKWTLEVKHCKVATTQVPEWFKPSARLQSTDAYWEPREECICNKSNKMLPSAK